MVQQHKITMRILDGIMSLGRSNIIPDTFLLNDNPVDTKMFTVDYNAGTITRVNQYNITREQYMIEYNYNEATKDYRQIRTERKFAALPGDEWLLAITEHLRGDSTNFNRIIAILDQIDDDVPPGTEEPYFDNVI